MNKRNLIIKVEVFLAKQGLPLRGHEENESSSNKENFLKLLDLLSETDTDLRDHLGSYIIISS